MNHPVEALRTARNSLAAGGSVLVAVFVGIGIGTRDGALWAWSPGLGTAAGVATAATLTCCIPTRNVLHVTACAAQ